MRKLYSLILALLSFAVCGWGQTTVTFTTPGTSTWTVPAGVTSITVSVWGAGGAGGGVDGRTKAGGGGEGGSFVRGTISVIPGATYSVIVGSGGVGAVASNGGNGGASKIILTSTSATIFNAIGGVGGKLGSPFGDGGSSANTGNIVNGSNTSNYYGGNGGKASNDQTASSGGGGGSAGAGGNGGTGGVRTAGAAGAGSGSPADAGAAGATGRGSGDDGNGRNGTAPGAGGSGARNANNGTDYQGGNGGNGQVKITYTTPGTYKDSWISMNIGSSSWCPGETRSVTVTVKNSGTAPWTDIAGVQDINIGVKWDGDPDYLIRVDAGGLVAGGTNTYTFNVTAPSTVGTNHLTFDVVYENVSWFGNNGNGVGPGNVVYKSVDLTISSPSTNAGPSNPDICQGGTTTELGGTVGGSATGGTWSDGGIGGTFSPNANTLDATWTPPAGYSGTATLTLTTTGGSCGTATSSKSQVVNPTLVAGSINADQTICYNSSPAALNSVSLPSGGTGSYTYQWQYSTDNSTWTNIGSTNSATYSPGNLSTTTYFRRTATSGACGTVYSNSVKITVLPQITSGQIGSAQSICYNTTPAAITNTTSPSGGAGSFTYQWESSPNGTSGWTTIGGATSDSYQPGVLTTTTYYRRVETSGSCAPVYSNVIQITVYGNLTAGSVGASQTICYNAAPSTFTNITSPAGGTGTYTYQWQSSLDNSTWSDITGANSATYTAGNLTATTYFRRNVTSSGGCGTVSSASITVTVNPDLVAGSIGADQTICYNTSPATLNSVSLPSGGTGSYTYQWQSSPDNITWTNIGSTNSATYSPGNLSTTTYFRRSATSGTCGTVYSNSVLITVLPQITSGQIGSAQSICYNTTPAAITNTTSPSGGAGSFTYQWESSPNGTSGWTTIGGATSDSYQPGVLTTTTYYRRVETSGTCAPVYSNVIQITVYGNLTAGSVGASQTICYNAAPSTFTNITSPSGGTGTYTYQWQSSPDNSTWSDITGANSATYTAGNLTATTYFRRNVTSSGGCGTVSSASITVTVNPDLVAGSIGADQTICYNTSPATLNSVSLPTGGTGSYTYQWQSSPDNSTWTNIVSATSSTYAPGTLTQTTYFRRTETSGTCGTVNSNVVTITVNPLPTATISGTTTVCQNSPQPQITFTGANGTAPYTFTYTINGGSPQTVTTVSGNSVTVNVPTAVAGTFTYALVSVQDGSVTSCSQAQSGTAVVTVKTPPSISVNPINVNTCATLPVNFNVTATGDDLTYQWYKVGTPDVAVTNSSNISGAQTANLHFNQASVADDGNYYVVVSGNSACAVATSTTATLTVNEQMVFTQQPVSTAVCSGGTATLSVTVTGGVGVTYQWRRGTSDLANGTLGSGAVISGVKSPTLQISNATTSESATNYNVIANSLAGCTQAFSTSASVIVNPIPTVNDITDKALCNGSSTGAINFTGSVAGTVYNWTNNNPAIGLAASGTGNIPAFNVTNSTNAPITATITVTPSYTNAGSPSTTCTGAPITFTITVNPTVSVNTISDQSLCNGASTSAIHFTSPNTGGSTVYNWTNSVPAIGLPASGTGDIAPFAAINNGTAPLIATITVTPTFTNSGSPSSACVGTPITFTITVNPTPKLSSSLTPPAICNNTTFSYNPTSATSGVTFNWSRAVVAGISNAAASGTGNPNETLNNTTPNPVSVIYVYTLSGNGCSNTQNVTVVVNPTPVLSSSLTPPDVCSNSSFNYTPASLTSGTTFTWTRATVPGISNGASSGSGNINETLINTSGAPINVTYVYTLTANGCSNTQNVVVKVNPTVTIAPLTQEVCNNTPISTINISGLPAGAITSWTRTSPPGIASSDIPTSGSGAITGTFVNSTTASINVTFTLNATAGNGCVTSSTAVVTVDAPLVAPVVSKDQFVCYGGIPDSLRATALLGGHGTVHYQWQSSNDGLTNWNNIPGEVNQSYKPTNNTGYYRVYAYNDCGSDTSNFAKITYQGDFGLSIDQDDPPQPLCNKESFTYHIERFSVRSSWSDEFIKYNWIPQDPSLISSSVGNPYGTWEWRLFIFFPYKAYISNNPTDPSYMVTNNTDGVINTSMTIVPTVYYRTVDSVLCNLSPVVIPVTIYPSAKVNDITSQTVCAGSTVTVPNFSSPTTGGTITYSWSNNNSSIGLASSGTGNISSFTATNSSTTSITATITVTPSFTNGGKTCTGTSKTFTITVNPSPVVTITPAAQTICTGSATNIGLTSNVSGSAINWSVISQTGVTGASAGSGTSISQTLIATGSTPGIVVYSVNASANGCTGTAKTVTVTVNPTPVAAISVTDATVCSGSGTTVTITGTPNTSVTYTVNGVAATPVTLSTAGTYTINTGNLTSNTTYALTGIQFPSAPNCAQSLSSSITVNVNPTATASISGGGTICKGQSASIILNGTPNTIVTYNDGVSDQTATLDGSGNATVTLSPTATTTYNLKTVAYGSAPFCTQNLSGNVTITVNPDANAGTLTASGSTTLCIGSTVTLNSNGDAGNWSSDNTGVAIVNPSTGVVTAVGAGSANIIYTVTSGCNNPKSASMPITVNPNATAGVLSGYNGTPVCATSNVNLYSSVTGGVWTSGNTSIATVDPSSGVVSPKGPGTVTITYTINSGCNAPATATIDVSFVNAGSTLTPGAITGPTGNICPNEDGFTFSVNTVTDASYYLWQLPAGWTITSADPLSNNITVKTGYTSGTVKVSAGNACTYNSNTSDLIVKLHNVWAGVVDTDWNKAGNWSDNQVSSSSCPDIVIPSSATNQPVIPSGTVQINNLVMIGNSASLTLNNTANLRVSGSITIPIGSYIDVTDATIEFNGSSVQNISGSNFRDTTIKNLIISNSAGVTVSSAGNSLAISGKLSFGSSNGKFNSGDNVTLRSTKERTASLGEVGTNNTVSGQFTVERYINSGTGAGEHGKKWLFLATPTGFDGVGQTIKQSWMENGNNASTGYGTNMTGPTGTTGWDAVSPAPSLKDYDSNTNFWKAAPSSSNQLYNPKGWMVFVRGDRSVTGISDSAKPTILRAKGHLLTGTKNFVVPQDPTETKFTSIGNPYASAVDMREVLGNDGIFTVWDPYVAGEFGLGAYRTYTRLGMGDFTGGAGHDDESSNFILSGQAFFIQSDKNAAQNITFNESAKGETSANTTVFRQGAYSIGSVVSTFRSNIYSNNLLMDGTLHIFSDDFSNDLDAGDGRKMLNSSVNLSLKVANKLLVIERRQLPGSTDTIFYNLTGTTTGKYKFEFIAKNLTGQGRQAWLEDDFTKQRTEVNMEGTTEITFDITADAASKAANRFRIVFMTPEASPLPVTFVNVKATRDGAKVNVEWSVAQATHTKNYVVMASADGIHFKDLDTVKATDKDNYTFVDSNPVVGYNYYRIRSVSVDGAESYSEIVRVFVGAQEPRLRVFPNPVTHGTIYLRMENYPAGNYQIRLLNPGGQVMLTRAFTHAGGNYTEKIPWDYKMAHGNYSLEVKHPDGSIKVIVVMY